MSSKGWRVMKKSPGLYWSLVIIKLGELCLVPTLVQVLPNQCYMVCVLPTVKAGEKL